MSVLERVCIIAGCENRKCICWVYGYRRRKYADRQDELTQGDETAKLAYEEKKRGFHLMATKDRTYFQVPSKIRAEKWCSSRISSRILNDFYEHCRQAGQAIFPAVLLFKPTLERGYNTGLAGYRCGPG